MNPEVGRGTSARDVATAMAEAGHRVTASRRAVIDLIFSRDGTFDSSDLVADARRRRIGAARATIFRTLEVLVDLCALERLDLPDGKHSYVRCDIGRHHHHLVCTGCQRSVDLDRLGMAPIMAEVASRTGYRIDRHRVELFGLCPTCQTQAPANGE
ncbi:MAG TPA: Fur family transcriptional regulator [Candidatus Limnocylindrales bacterium]